MRFRWEIESFGLRRRHELKLRALKIDATVDRYSNGKWFWVALVRGVVGKTDRVYADAERAKRAALRWIRQQIEAQGMLKEVAG